MSHDSMVTFPAKDRQIEAYLARPDPVATPRAAVLVVHELWGLDDHIKDVARRIAAEGYVALAPDLYTGDLRTSMRPENILAGMTFLRGAPPEVQRDPAKWGAALDTMPPERQRAIRTLQDVMSPARQAVFADELLDAAHFLRSESFVDPNRTGAFGFCMGGGLCAQLATLDPELRACVIFYGANPPLDRVPRIRAAVLGLYGGKDARITDTVPSLTEAMRAAGRPFETHVYPDAAHAFFNDTRPTVYNAVAAADAWSRLKGFLERTLGASAPEPGP
ncbi:MAG: dienelactone hydrolase family protein [Thermoplasmata archaeon]|nr:dienelactone hydrolase family protein [Thermoplasmata archaeon]